MHHSEIINRLIKAHGYESYLEIGVYDPKINFDKIDIKRKISVDPDIKAGALIYATSDRYFEILKEAETGQSLDIVFVDGLHHAWQVYKDVINSLKHLKEGGTIICHDIIPRDHDAQVIPRKS